MTNTDDPSFDDLQNPQEEQDRDQLELDFLGEDVVKPDDAQEESVDLDSFFENSTHELDLPDESQMGENTATYADELDMFGDLDNPQVADEGTVVPLDDVEFVPPNTVETHNFDDDLGVEMNMSDEVDDNDAAFADELPGNADEMLTSDVSHDVYGDPEAVEEMNDHSEIPDDPDQPLLVEEVPIVQDNKAKKGKKEKPPKKEKPQKVKKEKPLKVKKEKQPWNITPMDVALGISVISIAIGCLFLAANWLMNH